MNHNFTFMQINGINNEGITQVNSYMIMIENYGCISNSRQLYYYNIVILLLIYIITITQDNLKSFLVLIFASIHLSVAEYSNRTKIEVKHLHNVTSATYLEMINRYKE